MIRFYLLIVSIQSYQTNDFKKKKKKERKKATTYCTRFGRSLRSANQLPAREMKTHGIPSANSTSRSSSSKRAERRGETKRNEEKGARELRLPFNG